MKNTNKTVTLYKQLFTKYCFFIFRILVQALSIRSNFWIGLRKYGSLWIWVTGEYTATAAIYWQQNEPNNKNGSEDCGCIRIADNRGRTTNDENCWHRKIALCEKEYFPNN